MAKTAFFQITRTFINNRAPIIEQQISRIVSEGSQGTEDWNNDAGNCHRNNFYIKYKTFKIVIIFHYQKILGLEN